MNHALKGGTTLKALWTHGAYCVSQLVMRLVTTRINALFMHSWIDTPNFFSSFWILLKEASSLCFFSEQARSPSSMRLKHIASWIVANPNANVCPAAFVCGFRSRPVSCSTAGTSSSSCQVKQQTSPRQRPI